MAQDGQGMGGMPGMDSNGLGSLQQSDGGDGNIQGGNANNALLAQQQALMAMAAGGGNAGMDAGASRDALMNLLANQGTFVTRRHTTHVRAVLLLLALFTV